MLHHREGSGLRKDIKSLMLFNRVYISLKFCVIWSDPADELKVELKAGMHTVDVFAHINMQATETNLYNAF